MGGRSFENQCGGKKAYADYFEARAAQLRLNRKKGRHYQEEDKITGKHQRLHAYKCRYCHYWHLGRSATWKRKEDAKPRDDTAE